MNGTASASATSSNRRFIMLALVLGVLGAVLLYTAVSRNNNPGPAASNAASVPVVVAKVEIPARTRITAAMVEVRQVPANTQSFLAFTNVNEVVGQVSRFPMAANEHILSSKIVQLDGQGASRSLSFVIPPGHRAFSIRVSEVQSAGGLVLPGDYVDVIIIYDIEFPKGGDREKVDSYFVQTIFQNIEVLAVSQAIVDLVQTGESLEDGQRARNTEARPNPDAATVTLALTPDQVQHIYLAESNGRIRLSVRPYGDREVRPIDYMVELELFPRDLPNPFLLR